MSDNETSTYTIGELANEFDVTSRALRLYEESQLLAPKRAGTRRIYSERDRVRLRLILRGKRLGWSLADVKEVFDLYDSSHGEEAQLVLMLDKLAERHEFLKTQQKDIENSLEDLENVTANAEQALAEIRAGKTQTITRSKAS
ncbi:MAG: MerR family DNA-binding transcriptional regulator [Gammaproteobacteria bacterium]|nr:MerR family DNA-binding transcriptional regulator [Gammaproteobacteria bacterium]